MTEPVSEGHAPECIRQSQPHQSSLSLRERVGVRAVRTFSKNPFIPYDRGKSDHPERAEGMSLKSRPKSKSRHEPSPTARQSSKSSRKPWTGRRAGSPPRRGKVPPHRRKTRKEHLRLRPQRPRPNRGLLLRTPKPRRAGKVRQRRPTRTRPDRRRDRGLFKHARAARHVDPLVQLAEPPQPTTPPSTPTRSPPSAKPPPSAAPNQ